MKRNIIIILTLFSILGVLAEDGTGTIGGTPATIDGLKYKLNEEMHEAILDNGNCWDGNMELPSMVSYNGRDYVLTGIGSYAFTFCETLTGITIPETVREIRYYMPWYGNHELIKAPFTGCKQLEAIEVNENNPWICSVDGVLYNKEITQLYNYPSGSKRISFEVPEGVQAIGSEAFAQNSYLHSVSIPNTVERIYYAAFQGCESIEQVTILGGITEIEQLTFQGCSNLKSIILPESLTTLGETVFMDCSSLRKIDLPKSMRGISSTAFLRCSLDTLIIRGHIDNVNNGFLSCLKETAKLYVPALEIDRYKNVFAGDVLPLETYREDIEIEVSVTYTQGQMATIILPTVPDASKGKYYRLDRCENGQIVFEQELHPQARTPYIIVPDEDFSIDLATLDLTGLSRDTVAIEGISFIGSYVRTELPASTGGEGSSSYIDIIDLTPDCGLLPSEETGQEAFLIGALRAYLIVNWDDPIYYGGTRGKQEKPGIVLKDYETGIDGIQNSEFKNQNEEGSIIYDLSGRKIVNSKSSNSKSQRGIYIEKGRKVVK